MVSLSTGTLNQLLGAAGGTPAGKGFAEIFNLGILKVFGSPRPANANAAETGTLLCSFTAAGATYTPANGTNGLVFDDPVSGVLVKEPTQIWSGVCVADGTAYWARFYPVGSSVTGASDTIPRFDMSVGTSNADINFTSVAFRTGTTQSISEFSVTLPATGI